MRSPFQLVPCTRQLLHLSCSCTRQESASFAPESQMSWTLLVNHCKQQNHVALLGRLGVWVPPSDFSDASKELLPFRLGAGEMRSSGSLLAGDADARLSFWRGTVPSRFRPSWSDTLSSRAVVLLLLELFQQRLAGTLPVRAARPACLYIYIYIILKFDFGSLGRPTSRRPCMSMAEMTL